MDKLTSIVSDHLPGEERHLKYPQTRIILIHGPPGMGKTHMARKLARKLNYNMIEPDFCSIFNRPDILVRSHYYRQYNAVYFMDRIDDVIRMILKKESGEMTLDHLTRFLAGFINTVFRVIVMTAVDHDLVMTTFASLGRRNIIPLEVSFIDWSALQKICMAGFNQQTTLEPVPIRVPTGEIIHLALRWPEHQFKEFEAELTSLLHSALR